MSIQVTIQGTTYTLNQQSDNAPWGEQLSDLLQTIVDVANNSVGPNDILTTSFSIANNVSSATNVNGLNFDPSQVRSAIINYSLYRHTNSNELSECGQILITYKTTAGTWELAQTYAGSSGVTFTITNTGQIKYTSTNVSGSSYTGKMKFNARAFTQT